MPSAVSGLRSQLSANGPPVTGEGNTHPVRPAPASPSTATARSDSGTRCVRLAFIAAAGMVQVAASRSMSSQRARRASPERNRAQHRELEAETHGRRPGRAAHRGERGGDLGEGQRPAVGGADLRARQRGHHGVAGGVVVAVAFGDGPLHDRVDALADLPGHARRRRPDRCQHGHDVGGGDGVDALAPDAGEGVALERGAPPPGELRPALPAGLADGDHRIEGVGERRGAAGAPACGAGVAAAPGYPAVLQRDLAGLLERDVCEAAEAELALAAVDGEALDPGLAAAAGAGLDEEVEAVAVAVSPWAVAGGDGADECGVEGMLCHVRVPRVVTTQRMSLPETPRTVKGVYC